MDYKSKNPDLSAWKTRCAPDVKPCPFDIGFPLIYEFISPDDSTTFIGIMASDMPEEYLPFLYLAEAPRHCPTRICMETGDIEMYDFWMSRPWLIELQFSIFDNSYFNAKYINPMLMCQDAHNKLRSDSDLSPLDRKLNAIKVALADDEQYKPRRAPAWRKKLADFMIVYEQKKALAKKYLKCA
jgi:hypothetical protein